MSHRRMRHLKPREIQGCSFAVDSTVASSLYNATTGGDLVAANGTVARWEDQSGNGRHVTQATENLKFIRKVSSQGGSDVLQMSATYGSNMRTDSFFPSSGNADVTVMSVSKAGSRNYGFAWAYGTNAAGRRPAWAAKFNISRSCMEYNGSFIGRESSPIEINTWHTHTWRATSATTTLSTSQRINGIAITSFPFQTNPTTLLNVGTAEQLSVGAFFDAGPQWNIDFLGLVATYDRSLPTAVAARLESAAMRKWRIKSIA